MRLNWFSPLPPEQTDIAHYTARLAPALMDHFEVVFWTELRVDVNALPVGAAVRIFDPRRIEGRYFNSEVFHGLNVYNFGNDSRFHAGIYRVAQKIPGLAVLHDTRLHHFVFELSRNDQPPFASYIALASELYGKSGEARARSIAAAYGQTIDQHVEKMPFMEAFVENAIGVVCHSKSASAEAGMRSNIPTLTLPLPFARTKRQVSAPRVWAPPWRLVMFGYINPNRRLESIIHALAGIRDNLDFQFDIYGTLWNEQLVQTMIVQSGLTKRITIHGFVPESDLDNAIASAHMAFNLRYPTMGEASGGILRSWACATPTMVTDAGWYADLADDLTKKISVEDEVVAIRSALDELVRCPLKYREMGLRAQAQLVEAHSPKAYAESLVKALSDLPRLMTRAASRRMLTRVAVNSRSPRERNALLDRATAQILHCFFKP